jgi:hypothetical protein
MKRVLFIFLTTNSLLLAACSINAYIPAQLNKDISYQPKPMSSDSVKTANYLSGSVFNGAGADVTGNDQLIIGQLDYSRAHKFKNFDVAYGGYGFMGSIKNNSITVGDPYYFEHKSLYGFGARLSADYITTDDRTDFRSGLSTSFSKELGDFSAFRTMVKDKQDFVSNDQSLLFSAGISNEFVMHNRKYPSFQYGGRVFFGHSFSRPTFLNDIWISGFGQVGCFFGVAEIGAGTKLSFGYRF